MMLWIAGGLGLLAAAMFLRLPRGAKEGEDGELPLYAQAKDRRPFGEAMARRMWQFVMDSEPGYGIVPNGHRDYCGHGLARVGQRVVLCTVEDGWPRSDRPIASWDDEEEFVAFFARQSNYTINGYDRSEPVFFTEDEWALANQRLTREAVRRVLDAPPPPENPPER